MVNCPHCGQAVAKPERKIENSAFCIELYKCPHCGKEFKRFT